jgi:hypothetical protein
MKTLILSILLIFGLTTQNYSRPIVDVFSIKDPVLGEELYINDIPFNTQEIAVASILDGDELKLEEEAYVDDIPFDTEALAGKYLLNLNLKTSDEANINDLPFSTEKVFYEKLTERLTEQYRDETGTNDIPASTDNTFCCFKFNVPRSAFDILKVSSKESARQ